MAPIISATEVRSGMWVILPGEQWPSEVVKVTKAGPVIDLDERGPRRWKIRIRDMGNRFYDFSEDSLVATY